MPQKTVFIRDRDLDSWNSIVKKSQFIHEALKGFREPPAQGLVPPDPKTGYPCCTKAKPCKHWQWNEVDSVWRNELTEKIREVT